MAGSRQSTGTHFSPCSCWKRITARWLLILILTTTLIPQRMATAREAGILAASAPQTVESSSFIRVPADASLQKAIEQVTDGGVIEISSGTYQNSGKAFTISNTHKGFTLRAAPGASVILTGAGSHDILRYQNNNLENGKMVFFEGLVFANGYSVTDGVAGGLSLRYAQATFTNCSFENNNGNQPMTGGGAIAVGSSSLAYFTQVRWQDNRARNHGAGMAISEGAQVSLNQAEFYRNRTNFPGHSLFAAGGGIHVGNADLAVYNSHFEDNQAGYAGGAIYVIGNYSEPVNVAHATALIDRSTFINNRALKDASSSQTSPSEGGAVNVEDQAHLLLTNSRFITNSSDVGGGVNIYRAQAELDNNIFLGNQAVGSVTAFGGAISTTSNDGADSTTDYGEINRPVTHLTVRNAYIQGVYGSVTHNANSAGGIYAAGDNYHQYGLNGVSRMGTKEENRAQVILENIIFQDIDVHANAQGQRGHGAALITDLAEIHMQDILVMNSDAVGSEGSGGGLMFLNQTLAYLDEVTVAHNRAEKYGGGAFIQGSEVHLSNSRFIGNEVSPGVSEAVNQSYGAAIFTAPDDSRGTWVTGEVRDCIISNNTGLSVFDDDRSSGPLNEVRYNGNLFFGTTFWDLVYANALSSAYRVNAAGLNDLVVVRANGSSTDKSLRSNSQMNGNVVVGSLQAVPALVFRTDGAPEIFLGFAWDGSAANLDGTSLSGKAGASSSGAAGIHTLSVDGYLYQVEVIQIEPTVFIPLVKK